MFFSKSGKLVYEKQRDSKQQSVKDFFDKTFFKLFFDDPRYLLSVGNSPFFQLVAQKKQNILEERRNALIEFHKKVEEASIPNGSIFPGAPAEDIYQATSGQVSGVMNKFSANEYYFSWFGLATGLTVRGGYTIVLNDPDLVNEIAEGWEHYRNYLKSTPDMNGNQINTFNSLWLMHRLSDDYNASKPFEDFSINSYVKLKEKKLDTPDWVRLIFTLAKKYGDQVLTAYVFKLGQMNTTIGFVKIILKEVNREFQIYNELFQQNNDIPYRELSVIYKTEFSFERACTSGAIGCRELQPKGLRDHFYNESNPLKKADQDSLIQFRIYLAWIITMLNDKELNQKAKDFAVALAQFRSAATHGKSDRKNIIEKGLFEATNRNRFIELLTAMIEEGFEEMKILISLKDSILDLNPEKFRLFSTLLKFEYRTIEKGESK